jgi:hypothetical protein
MFFTRRSLVSCALLCVQTHTVYRAYFRSMDSDLSSGVMLSCLALLWEQFQKGTSFNCKHWYTIKGTDLWGSWQSANGYRNIFVKVGNPLFNENFSGSLINATSLIDEADTKIFVRLFSHFLKKFFCLAPQTVGSGYNLMLLSRWFIISVALLYYDLPTLLVIGLDPMLWKTSQHMQYSMLSQYCFVKGQSTLCAGYHPSLWRSMVHD